MTLKPKFTITNAITAALSRIERARGFLEAATLSDDWLRRMSERALVLEAHHTTHIEGTHLTLQQSERLMAGEKVPEADPDDTRELLNFRSAFELVGLHLNEGTPISEGLIREIHKRLVEGVRGGQARPGEYRTAQNYVVNAATGKTVYTPPPAGDVPEMMRDLVARLNSKTDIHPVLTSGIAQFELVHIHPFLDGNGRTSRLLSTLCLYRAGYDFKRLFTISEFYDRDRQAFYAALQSVRNADMNLTGWLEFFVAGLDTQLEEVKDRGKRVMRVDIAATKFGLNERQKTALLMLFERDAAGIHDYERLNPSVTRRTLQRDLEGLLEKKLIRSEGGTKNIRYMLIANAL